MEEECCCKVGCWQCQATMDAQPKKINHIPALAEQLWNAFFLLCETNESDLQYDDMRIGEDTVRFKFKDAWFEVKRLH